MPVYPIFIADLAHVYRIARIIPHSFAVFASHIPKSLHFAFLRARRRPASDFESDRNTLSSRNKGKNSIPEQFLLFPGTGAASNGIRITLLAVFQRQNCDKKSALFYLL